MFSERLIKLSLALTVVTCYEFTKCTYVPGLSKKLPLTSPHFLVIDCEKLLPFPMNSPCKQTRVVKIVIPAWKSRATNTYMQFKHVGNILCDVYNLHIILVKLMPECAWPGNSMMREN